MRREPVRAAAGGLRPGGRLRRSRGPPRASTSTCPTGQLVCVLGPSGSGKTTLLRAVAGLEEPRAGRDPPGRSRPGRRAAARARHRPDVPGLRALPAPRRGRQRRLRPAHARRRRRRGRPPACASSWRSSAWPVPSDARSASSPAASSSAWPSPGPWRRDRAAHARRADGLARPLAARAAARGAARHLLGPRADRPLRDARPGRGPLRRRPRRHPATPAGSSPTARPRSSGGAPTSAWVARFLGFRNVAAARLAEGRLETPWGRLPAEACHEAAAADGAGRRGPCRRAARGGPGRRGRGSHPGPRGEPSLPRRPRARGRGGARRPAAARRDARRGAAGRRRGRGAPGAARGGAPRHGGRTRRHLGGRSGFPRRSRRATLRA